MNQHSTSETSLSAGQLAAMIWSRRWMIVLCGLALMLLSLAATLVLPKTYRASSDVYVDYQSNDPISTRQFSPMLDTSYMEDQIALIESYEVSNRVVDALGLAQTPEFRRQTADMNEAQRLRAYRELINSVNRRVEVVNQGSSRVLQVRYNGGSPEGARDAANAVVQAYFSLTAELGQRAGRERVSLYDGQLAKMRQQADEAQRKLNDFEREQGLITTSSGENVSVGDLSNTLSKLVSVQVDRQRAQARWDSISAQLKAGMAPADIAEIATRGDIANIKGKLTDVERQLASARGPGVLGSGNPQLRALESERASLRRDLDRESTRALDAMRQLPLELAEQERLVQKEVDTRRGGILKTQEYSATRASLLRQLENAQRSFESASQRYGDLLISTNVAPSNLMVLRAAQTPETYTKPSRRINTIAGLMAGLFAGFGLALFLELSNRRLRSRDDIERSLGLTALGPVRRTPKLERLA